MIGDETPEKIRTLQRKRDGKAKGEPDYRFDLLDDKIYREDLRAPAYERAKAKEGAPGVEAQSFAGIEGQGREKWLTELKDELRPKRYRPQPVRGVMIPKPGGSERPLGITMRKIRTSGSTRDGKRGLSTPRSFSTEPDGLRLSQRIRD